MDFHSESFHLGETSRHLFFKRFKCVCRHVHLVLLSRLVRRTVHFRISGREVRIPEDLRLLPDRLRGRHDPRPGRVVPRLRHRSLKRPEVEN